MLQINFMASLTKGKISQLTTTNDFRKMTVYLLSRTKKTFQINQSEKIPGNVGYTLKLENQEFIFRLH